ncbi:MAG: ATPase [Betaproteobacteria bacterium]|nr:MAG: ATPase [Betaproteobacteria bacterium]
MTPHKVATIRYVIGIDGGGTGTRARLTRTDGEVLGYAQAGPSALGQGLQQAWNNVSQAIERSFHSAKVHGWEPEECAVGLGLAGAIVASQKRDFMQAANRFGEIELANDGYTALLGAHGGRPGALVAAGTGSIGEALRDDGRHVSVGGWGYPVGDEGSGAWLGMRAMREAQHATDGRGASGPLVRAVWAVAGDSREALLAWCEKAGQHAYAGLAPLVFDTEAADTRAAQLLNDAARALGGIALALDPDGRLPLVVSGSIGGRLQLRLTPSIRARLVEPAGDAVDGALHLIRARLEQTGRRFDDR